MTFNPVYETFTFVNDSTKSGIKMKDWVSDIREDRAAEISGLFYLIKVYSAMIVTGWCIILSEILNFPIKVILNVSV